MLSLSYFFDDKIGTNRARTIQVIKNCQAFSQIGLQVKLYAPLLRGIDFSNIQSSFNIDSQIAFRRTKYFGFAKFISNTLIMFLYALFDKSDIVYTRNIYFAFLIWFTRRIIVCEEHQFNFEPRYHTFLMLIILRFLSKRKRFFLIVISEALRKKIRESGIEMPILVCHDGFDSSIDLNQQIPKSLCKNGHEAVAMYAGTLTRMKGFGHIEYLAFHNQNVIFYVIGDIHTSCDKDILERLKNLDNVVLKGKISHADVLKYLLSADILLLLPTNNGVYNDVTSPLKLFEYMHAGKAILSTNLPSLKEILKNNVNSLIASDSDSDINQKFQMLVNDSNLRQKLGTMAQKYVAQYSWNNRARKIIAYIHKSIFSFK